VVAATAGAVVVVVEEAAMVVAVEVAMVEVAEVAMAVVVGMAVVAAAAAPTAVVPMGMAPVPMAMVLAPPMLPQLQQHLLLHPLSLLSMALWVHTALQHQHMELTLAAAGTEAGNAAAEMTVMVTGTAAEGLAPGLPLADAGEAHFMHPPAASSVFLSVNLFRARILADISSCAALSAQHYWKSAFAQEVCHVCKSLFLPFLILGCPPSPPLSFSLCFSTHF